MYLRAWHSLFAQIGVLVLAGLCSVACGNISPQELRTTEVDGPNTTASASTTTAVQDPAAPVSFIGPVFLFCEQLSSASENIPTTISIKKLDLPTRQLVELAEYPTGLANGCRGVPNQIWKESRLDAQAIRTSFSRDFTKMVVDTRKAGQVAYYDSKARHQFVVNDLIPHPTGDFDIDPEYVGASFTDGGLLMFLDQVSKTWKYFDTDTKAVVRESTEPESPAFWPPSIVRSTEDRSQFTNCYAAWSMPPGRYLSGRDDAIYSIPSEGGPLCGDKIQPVAPDNAQVLALASDSTGTDILMLVEGRNAANKLYRSNLQNPNAPTEIDLNGALGNHLNPAIAIIAWE